VLWIWLLGAALAADVLYPGVSPLTPADQALAESVYRQIVSAALQAGLSLEDIDGIRVWAGGDGEFCADTDGCPLNLWSRTDARIAVVLMIGQGSSGIIVETRLYTAENISPVKVSRETVAPGKEASFAARLALTVQELLPLVAPRPAPVIKTPETRVEPPPRQVVIEAIPEEKTPIVEEKPEIPAPPNHLKLPAGAYALLSDHVQAGGLEAEWLEQHKVRADRFYLDIWGGWGLGDVDRGYSVVAAISRKGEGFETLGESTWLGFGYGDGFSIGGSVGYSPLWWLDTSLALGVQYGQKHLYTAWYCKEGCDPAEDITDHDPVTAIQALVEPRLRLTPVAIGYVKPYLLLGATIRIYDGFHVPDPDFLDYSDALAGASVGPMAGAGLWVDATERLSFFLEAPASLQLPAAGVRFDDAALADPAPGLSHMGAYIRLTGGLEVLF
jgi:hypothetical protein